MLQQDTNAIRIRQSQESTLGLKELGGVESLKMKPTKVNVKPLKSKVKDPKRGSTIPKSSAHPWITEKYWAALNRPAKRKLSTD